MTSTTTVSSPLPEGLKPESLIAALHNHELYFKLVDPDLVSSKLVSGDPTKLGEKCSYEHVSAKHTSDYDITNEEDGITTSCSIKSPVGNMIVRLKWKVAEGKITEDIELEGNFVMRKMSKGPTEKNGLETQKRLFEELAKA